MTDAQKEMCGCDICLDARGMHNSLKSYRTQRLREYDSVIQELEQGNDPELVEALNALKEIRDGQVDALFKEPDRKEFKHDRMTQACAEMTCLPVGTTNVPPLKCALQRCPRGCRKLPS